MLLYIGSILLLFGMIALGIAVYFKNIKPRERNKQSAEVKTPPEKQVETAQKVCAKAAAPDFAISKDSDYRHPDMLFARKALIKLYRFYLYEATRHSAMTRKVILEGSGAAFCDALFEKMCTDNNIPATNFIELTSNGFSAEKKNAILSMRLDDSNFVADMPKGFYFNYTKKQPTHSLVSILEHIRDSFAHGRIATAQNSKYYIFEDKSDKKESKQLTARFVLSEAVLLSWIDIIESVRE
ncbi:MAG: hypothetical protein LBS90_06465 [Oscillospiraceae bacterium]|jgi:hypothetical protein|nr:hypothetical protein [Oscillospiraceae bacterium]